MMAENSRTPYMPRLEIAEEPPWYSAGLSFFSLARAARSFISLEMAESDFPSALRITGVSKPAVDRDRDADVGMLEAQNAVAGPHRVGGGHALQGERQRLDDEVVDRELVASFGAPALASSRIFRSASIVTSATR